MNRLLNEFGWAGPDRRTLIEKHALPTSIFLDCMGLKVHVSIEGSGPDVVMIHGFAASLHTWSDVCAQMSKQFRIIRFDLPPFGLTGPALDQQGCVRKMDVAFYQQFVDAVLDELQIKKCVMIGNSFGGFLSFSKFLILSSLKSTFASSILTCASSSIKFLLCSKFNSARSLLSS